jgi:3-oxoadipate enol-lactonase
MTMMMVNGCDLNVEIQGEGRPLLMLHGLGNNMASFRSDIEHFRTTRRAIAIDSRGHGLSGKPDHYTLKDHVDDVVGLMDALGLETVDLIGSSMGAYVAQGVAIEVPRRIRRLIIVAGKSHGATSSSAALLEKHADELKGSTVQQQRDFLYSKILAPSTSERRVEILQLLTQNRGLPSTQTEYTAAQQAIRNFDFRPQLAQITAATLVISGKYDPLNPPAEGIEIAKRIPNATFVLFENSGHLPRIEEQARYYALADNFLNAAAV